MKKVANAPPYRARSEPGAAPGSRSKRAHSHVGARSKQATPKRAIPKQATPKQAIPKQATPKQATPKQAIPKRAVAKPAIPAKAPAIASKPPPGDLDTVSWWEDFYRVVRLIPAGRVTTYGAVAAWGGHPRAARHVGYAMAALKDTKKHHDVPWQRVLGAAPRERARVTIKDPIGGAMQRAILEAEGVEFDALGRVALATFGWKGPSRRAR